jgi:hypothetical protein
MRGGGATCRPFCISGFRAPLAAGSAAIVDAEEAILAQTPELLGRLAG